MCVPGCGSARRSRAAPRSSWCRRPGPRRGDLGGIPARARGARRRGRARPSRRGVLRDRAAAWDRRRSRSRPRPRRRSLGAAGSGRRRAEPDLRPRRGEADALPAPGAGRLRPAARRLVASLPVGALRDALAIRSGVTLRRPRDRERTQLPDTLERLGVRTLGELAALPAEAVADRFGEPGLRALRLARGADEPLRPRRPHEEIESPPRPPRGRLGPAARARPRAADRATARPPRARRADDPPAADRGSARRRGGGWRCEVDLRSASASAERLRLALAPRLDELPGPAAWLGLRALELGPRGGEQGRWPARPPRSGAGGSAEAVRQVRSAAGRDAVLRVVEVDPGSRVPERRAILAPFGRARMSMARPQVYWPKPVEVEAGADGVPLRGRRGRRSRRCASSGWSRTAGGRRNPCKGGISRWCSPTVATSSSSASRPTARAGTSSGPEGATSSCTRTLVLVSRRCLAAGGARDRGGRVRLRGLRAHRPRQRLRRDGAGPGLQGPRACGRSTALN